MSLSLGLNFTQSLALIYVVAYVSLLVQFEGLYSVNGLLPMNDFMEMVVQARSGQEKSRWDTFWGEYPSFLLLDVTTGLPVETLAELVLLVGLGAALWVVVCGNNVVPTLLMVMCYLAMYLAGQTFLSFQWDILLLEVGWVLVVSSLFESSGRHSLWNWTYRLIIFKLMLMSGVVKLQAGCETWNGLTALSYHFATQCLPTPLAHFAHGLPTALLRVAVASTLVIEIPLTAMLIMPQYRIRRVGAVLQIVLQISILLTGNYNFFNVLTILLCTKAWEKDSDITDALLLSPVGKTTSPEKQGAMEYTDMVAEFGPVLMAIRFCFSAAWHVQNSWVGVVLDALVIVGMLWWSITAMFVVDWEGGNFELRPGLMHQWQKHVGWFSEAACLVCIAMGVLHMAAGVIRCTHGRSPSGVGGLFVALAGFAQVAWQGIILVPLQQIGGFRLADWFAPLVKNTRLWSFASGYGLFRRMTGVGSSGEVARPEIVLEGRSVSDGAWYEIDFLHKPTALDGAPTVVAPHQPRLDWQMWFAALGSYHHNVWLVNLVYKLLKGEQAIASLLREDTYAKHFKGEPPDAIRATLYDYDFTPRETEASENGLWWRRSNPREWLPILRLTDESLMDFLVAKGVKIHREPQDTSQKIISCQERVRQSKVNAHVRAFSTSLCQVHLMSDKARAVLDLAPTVGTTWSSLLAALCVYFFCLRRRRGKYANKVKRD